LGAGISGAASLATAALAVSRPAPSSPLNAAVSAQRRFATVSTDLADYRQVRASLGGTVNDVVLATVAGALRGWLLSRGEPVRPSSVIRAMLPVGVRPRTPTGAGGGGAIDGATIDGGAIDGAAVDGAAVDGAAVDGATIHDATSHDATIHDATRHEVDGGAYAARGDAVDREAAGVLPPSVGRVSSYLIDLPVGEANPVVRFSQLSYAMKAHAEGGQLVGADALAALSGVAPPTMHAMAARLAGSLAKRLFNLVITNVPGPQLPLYSGGARLLETYPVTALSAGQALAIGLTSYDGGVYFGLNADREALYDVEVLAAMIEESLAELVEASSASVRRG
jgi:hypothetical protein